MKIIKATILGIFLLHSASAFSSEDSLVMAGIRKFIYKEFGSELSGDFFTNWKADNNPYFVLYLSSPDSVSCAANCGADKYGFPGVYCRSEEDAYSIGLNAAKEKGVQFFVYKTYANASCMLNDRFVSYSNEAKCFIMFHELMHNFIIQNHISIPYYLNEALSDVVGNYGALDYCSATLNLDFNLTQQQITVNENIYECLNSYILRVNKSAADVADLNDDCYKEIQAFLKDANTFQTDRFNYKVNKGYLLKNSNYCLNYFLLKRVLLKQKSILKLIEIIKALPEKQTDQIKYLEEFT